jgi:hypothetical protein
MPSRDLSYQAIFLALSVVVFGLSLLLRVDARGDVTLPLVDLPLPPSCSFRLLTGHNCAGCGLTRCFVCLVRGEVTRAWNFNPAGLLVFALVMAQIPYRMAQLFRIRRGLAPWRFPGTPWLLALLVAALLTQWVWRAAAMGTSW